MKRGDIVTVATGRPRPAVVVQADHLLPCPMIILVPFTSEIAARPPPFTRINVDPSPIMAERIIDVPAAGLRPTGGRLEDDKMTELTRLLALWLGIA